MQRNYLHSRYDHIWNHSVHAKIYPACGQPQTRERAFAAGLPNAVGSRTHARQNDHAKRTHFIQPHDGVRISVFTHTLSLTLSDSPSRSKLGSKDTGGLWNSRDEIAAIIISQHTLLRGPEWIEIGTGHASTLIQTWIRHPAEVPPTDQIEILGCYRAPVHRQSKQRKYSYYRHWIKRIKLHPEPIFCSEIEIYSTMKTNLPHEIK